MAEQSGEKTYDATPYRRQQAREQGQVAYSPDLGSAALLLAGALVLMYWGRSVVETAANFLQQQLGAVGPLSLDETNYAAQGQWLLQKFGWSLLPILGLLALAGALSTVMQIGLLFVPDRLKPDLSRLSPGAGIKRIFSLP